MVGEINNVNKFCQSFGTEDGNLCGKLFLSQFDSQILSKIENFVKNGKLFQ